MKVLVTGSTGFIGRHVLQRLNETEHSVRCLVRKTSDTKVPERIGAEIMTGDVTDRSSVKQAISGTDAVIHLANIYEFWIPDKRDFYRVNIEGTRNVMEEALAANIRKVVHVSTAGIYGNPDDRPFTEESTPAANRTCLYFETKYQGDQVVWELYENNKLPVVVVYPTGVTGPGDSKPSGRYIYYLIKRKMPSQVFLNSIVTWVDVRDVAEIIVRALDKEGNIGEKYIAAAERLSFAEFNQFISQASGVPLPRITMPTWMVTGNAAVLTFFANIFKIRPMLGLSNDQVRTMKEGFSADGTKAVKELGIQYKPIKKSIEDAVAALD